MNARYETYGAPIKYRLYSAENTYARGNQENKGRMKHTLVWMWNVGVNVDSLSISIGVRMSPCPDVIHVADDMGKQTGTAVVIC